MRNKKQKRHTHTILKALILAPLVGIVIERVIYFTIRNGERNVHREFDDVSEDEVESTKDIDANHEE